MPSTRAKRSGDKCLLHGLVRQICIKHIDRMQNVVDIFAAWPSDAEFGRDIGVPYPTISAWKQRASIPAAYWWPIVRAAVQRGHPEITADLLARLHARKANNGPPSG